MAVQPEDVHLLAESGFRRFMESRAVFQIGQNALLYTLLILIVSETGSSIHSTLLVTAWSVPSIVLGIPAGGLADILPRRALLVLAHGLRAALAVAMIIYTDDVWTIYLLVLLFSTLGQFTGPAESAALPALVRQEELAGGNSWMTFTIMVGQAAGAVALAPIVLKLFGARVALAVSAALFVAAGFLVSSVRGLQTKTASGGAQPARGGPMDALTAGWAVLRSSRPAFLALVYLTGVGTLAKALAVLAPRYMEDVLSIEPENTVFVVAPAAIGALVALVLTPPLARWFGAAKVAAVGFVLYVLGVAGLGLVVLVRDFLLDNVDLGLTFVEEEVGVSSVITMAMILAIPVGFAATVVGVAGKAVLNQEAPQGKQARVFATQSALSDALSLLPLFAIGGVAELVGVREVLLVAASVAFVAGVYLSVSRRFGPPEPPAAAGQPTSS